MGFPDPTNNDHTIDLDALTDLIVDAYLAKTPIDDPAKLDELKRTVSRALHDCNDRGRQPSKATDYVRDPRDPEYAW